MTWISQVSESIPALGVENTQDLIEQVGDAAQQAATGARIKQTGNRYCIIEINDNPNVDAGNEDGVLKDALYREVMGVFHRRLEQRRAGGNPA